MNICAIIVTFNRKILLQKVLQSFDQLSSTPDSIVIVDNNSTDGTNEIIENWRKQTTYKNIHQIKLPQNIGGSGGFYEGMSYALTLNPDWIWLSDDDAIPDKECFSIIRNKLSSLKSEEYSAVCCSVINKGVIDNSHRRRLIKKILTVKEYSVAQNEYENDEFSLDLFSYVGVVINVDKLKQAGLTEKDYFIWYDDSEHSWRLSLYGKIICIPKAKIYHNIDEDDDLNWKAFYGTRNRLLMFKKHHYLTYMKHIYLLKKKIFLSKSLKKDPIYKKMLIAAVSDAMNNKKGLHTIYKPGWEIKS